MTNEKKTDITWEEENNFWHETYRKPKFCSRLDHIIEDTSPSTYENLDFVTVAKLGIASNIQI